MDASDHNRLAVSATNHCASVATGFAIAYPFAFLANRYMIARGKGHALVHTHHQV